jgi:hypothetical protein
MAEKWKLRQIRKNVSLIIVESLSEGVKSILVSL